MEINKALQATLNYINTNGGLLHEWYVGITGNVEQRLFSDHAVDKQFGQWVHCTLSSSTDARNLEAHMLRQGCKGDVGGGDDNANIMYCYKITTKTRQ